MDSIQVESLRGVSPILLGTFVDLTQRGNAIGNMDALNNIMRVPIMIDEIRFMTRIGQLANVGNSIRCSLRMGQHVMTDGQIPIWNFGTVIDDDFDYAQSSSVGGVGFGSNVAINQYRWVLPRPLLVPPGNAIVPSFSRQADGFNDATNVRVWITYAGRLLGPDEPRPDEIPIPYVACWNTTTAAVATRQSPISGEALQNPFQQPLHVQRLIGRVLDVSEESGETLREPSATLNNIQAKITDSNGYIFSRDFLPFGTLFNRARRAVTFNRILGPRQHYTVYLQVVSAESRVQQPSVSMIGWRNERVSY